MMIIIMTIVTKLKDVMLKLEAIKDLKRLPTTVLPPGGHSGFNNHFSAAPNLQKLEIMESTKESNHFPSWGNDNP